MADPTVVPKFPTKPLEVASNTALLATSNAPSTVPVVKASPKAAPPASVIMF